MHVQLKEGHHRHDSETRFACGPIMAQIECWLGSFVIFQGIPTNIARTSYFCDFSREGVRTPCPPSRPADDIRLGFQICKGDVI